MAQNIYDDPIFFGEYAKLPRSQEGLDAAPEWPTLRQMIVDGFVVGGGVGVGDNVSSGSAGNVSEIENDEKAGNILRGRRVLDLGCGYGWFCRWAAREAGAASVHGVDISANMLARAREFEIGEGEGGGETEDDGDDDDEDDAKVAEAGRAESTATTARAASLGIITYERADLDGDGEGVQAVAPAATIPSATGGRKSGKSGKRCNWHEQHGDDEFDLVYSSLTFHYVADVRQLFRKIHSVLKPGGKFVFSIEHPIYTAPVDPPPEWQRDDTSGHILWPLNNYSYEGPRKVRWLGTSEVHKQHRTMETYMSALLGAGFTLTALMEWTPTDQDLEKHPDWVNVRHRPIFLLVSATATSPGATKEEAEAAAEPAEKEEERAL